VTAPAEQEQQQRQRVPKVRHKLCYLQALAAHYGQPRITLCGKTFTGPPKRDPAERVPCPMCMEVRPAHRAGCHACQQAGWTA
jgi:hypothetical protein